jgi:hypothetical protein
MNCRLPLAGGGSFLLLCGIACAQVNTSPLVYIQTIGVPNWTNTGSTQVNTDIFGFNPLTHTMYMADRTNHAVDAIDTHENVVTGIMVLPNNPNTNGVLVAPDLQQLVVTDGKTNVYVYDLRLPGSGPDVYNLPNIGGGTDALDYDPLNHTVYVINGSKPYYMNGINLVTKTVTQFQLPGSPELMRWNPIDGLIYQVITDSDNQNAGAGVAAYDPVANTMKPTYLTPGCVPHGIEIDPVTDIALLGCGPGPQTLMNLKTGTVVKSFPQITTTDLTGYNPNTRDYYTGSGGNKANLSGCPTDSASDIPVIGVFDSKGPAAQGYGELIGIQCSGRNIHGPGVDPLQNFVYASTRQYPTDPNDANTGQNGVLVYWDPSAPAQAPVTKAQVTLKALAAGGPTGSMTMTMSGRVMHADAVLQSISGSTAVLNVTTTVGNEQVDCAVNPGGPTHCDADLIGDPMIGGSVLLGVDGAPVAQGTIASGS